MFKMNGGILRNSNRVSKSLGWLNVSKLRLAPVWPRIMHSYTAQEYALRVAKQKGVRPDSGMIGLRFGIGK